jgi:hypothetical protein
VVVVLAAAVAVAEVAVAVVALNIISCGPLGTIAISGLTV